MGMLTFKARRSKPEMVVPARATPREVRSLSDVDNQLQVRTYNTFLEFFGCRVPGEAPPPGQLASSLKGALAEALVHYYPMAGRLRELPGAGGKKLVVDCTAEGVVFVEAHADVRLVELGQPLVQPYPCVEEFMLDMGDPNAVIGRPLIYMQVTQLRCGGLVLMFTMCHSVVDGFGAIQVLRCILELARGRAVPAVLPVWDRHILLSPDDDDDDDDGGDDACDVANMVWPPLRQMVTRSFLFGAREIAGMRSRVAGSFSAFELITAAVWRCRVAALEYAPNMRQRLVFSINERRSRKHVPPLPPGFYGNAAFCLTAEASADELCQGSLGGAAEIVHQAKLKFTAEQLRSDLRLMARGEYKLDLALDGFLLVSDNSTCGNLSLDLGSWAEYVGGGMPRSSSGAMFDSVLSVYYNCKDTNGDECVAVPMSLPELAMGRFTSLIAATVTKNVVARSSM